MNSQDGADFKYIWDTRLHSNPLQQRMLLDLGNVANGQADLKHNTALSHYQFNGLCHRALQFSLGTEGVGVKFTGSAPETRLTHLTQNCTAGVTWPH